MLTKTSGCVYGIDIQEVALKKTLNKLELEFSESELKRIKLFNQSHATFPEIIPQESISAIMYNLGYLPGGSKNIITRPSSTIMSLKSGRSLLKPGGIITILCYRGHDGGPDETDAVLKEISSLDSQYWEINTYDLLKSTSSPLLMTVVRKFAS